MRFGNRLLGWLGAAALVVGGVAAATPAEAHPGVTRVRLNLRAGPGVRFPVVHVFARGAVVDVLGCLEVADWCDVAWRGGRGWVSATYLDLRIDGRRVRWTRGRVRVVTWDLDTYWYAHYRTRTFYAHRARYRVYDRDDNPPGPRGGPGTNWENPPGPRGGPGASPDRRRGPR